MAKIVFIGAERTGLACLRRLIEMKKEISAVITADDAIRGRIRARQSWS